MPADTPLSAAGLRARFDADRAPFSVGLEEELMLLDPQTLDLAPVAAGVVEAAGDARFKLELPAAQLELVTPPAPDVPAAVAALAEARGALAAATGGLARPAGSATHPFAAVEGDLNRGERYDAIRAEYGTAARRQLVFGLHVHVAVPGAGRALAVHDALRSYLPELAALAGNGPLHDGRDSGMASVRPKLSELLPRQGVPPALGTWDAYAAALGWVGDPRLWWWELRLHPAFATVEVRVPDVQRTVAETAAVAAVVHALVVWLAERHDAGEPLAVAPVWRIAENRWSACRHGLDGALRDLETGAVTPTRDRLTALLAELAPVAGRLGCAAELEAAHGLVAENGSVRQRAIFAGGGPQAVTTWLADGFLA